jgi:hypothetical protein
MFNNYFARVQLFEVLGQISAINKAVEVKLPPPQQRFDFSSSRRALSSFHLRAPALTRHLDLHYG